ncbi:hypothetical protein AAMO2058_001562100 [Amorphochlora amoebiformis]
MDIRTVLREIRIGRDVERKDGLGKLRARLAKKGLAGFDLEELFSLLRVSLVDPAWPVCYQCLLLLGELAQLRTSEIKTSAELSHHFSVILPKLIVTLGAKKGANRKAALNALLLIVKNSSKPQQITSVLSQCGFMHRDPRVRQNTIIATPVLVRSVPNAVDLKSILSSIVFRLNDEQPTVVDAAKATIFNLHSSNKSVRDIIHRLGYAQIQALKRHLPSLFVGNTPNPRLSYSNSQPNPRRRKMLALGQIISNSRSSSELSVSHTPRDKRTPSPLAHVSGTNVGHRIGGLGSTDHSVQDTVRNSHPFDHPSLPGMNSLGTPRNYSAEDGAAPKIARHRSTELLELQRTMTDINGPQPRRATSLVILPSSPTSSKRLKNESKSEVLYGFLPSRYVDWFRKYRDTKDYRARINATAHINKALQDALDSEILRAEIIRHHSGEIIRFFLTIIQDRHFKVTMTGLQMLHTLIDKLGSGVSQYLHIFIPKLVSRLTENKLIVRVEMKIFRSLLLSCGAGMVLCTLLTYLADERWLVRLQVVHVIIMALLISRLDPSLPYQEIASTVALVLDDPKKKVRYCALHCLAVLSDLGGQSKLMSAIRNLLSPDSKAQVLARLEDLRLPRLDGSTVIFPAGSSAVHSSLPSRISSPMTSPRYSNPHTPGQATTTSPKSYPNHYTHPPHNSPISPTTSIAPPEGGAGKHTSLDLRLRTSSEVNIAAFDLTPEASPVEEKSLGRWEGTPRNIESRGRGRRSGLSSPQSPIMRDFRSTSGETHENKRNGRESGNLRPSSGREMAPKANSARATHGRALGKAEGVGCGAGRGGRKQNSTSNLLGTPTNASIRNHSARSTPLKHEKDENLEHMRSKMAGLKFKIKTNRTSSASRRTSKLQNSSRILQVAIGTRTDSPSRGGILNSESLETPTSSERIGGVASFSVLGYASETGSGRVGRSRRASMSPESRYRGYSGLRSPTSSSTIDSDASHSGIKVETEPVRSPSFRRPRVKKRSSSSTRNYEVEASSSSPARRKHNLGDKIEKRVCAEYATEEDLAALADPQGSLRKALRGVSDKEWSGRFESMNMLRRLAIHHSSILRPHAKGATSSLVKNINSLRSIEAKNGILTICDFIKSLKKGMDPLIETLVPVLIKRAGETSGFIAVEAHKALDLMVTDLTRCRVLTALLGLFSEGSSKTKALRPVCSEYIYKSSVALESKLSSYRQMEKLITTTGMLLSEGLLGIRRVGKRLTFHLVSILGQSEVLKRSRRLLTSNNFNALKRTIDKGPTGEETPDSKGSGRGWPSPSSTPSRRRSSTRGEGGHHRRVPSAKTRGGGNRRRGGSSIPEELSTILEGMDERKDWRARILAMETLAKKIESGDAPKGAHAKLLEGIGKRLDDGNTKVNVAALQALGKTVLMLKNLPSVDDQIRSYLISNVASHTAASNPSVRKAAKAVMKTYQENLHLTQLLHPIAHCAQFGKLAVRPHMVQRLADITPSCSPSLIKKHILPLIVALKGSSGDMRERYKGLTQAVHRILGDGFFEAPAIKRLGVEQREMLKSIIL